MSRVRVVSVFARRQFDRSIDDIVVDRGATLHDHVLRDRYSITRLSGGWTIEEFIQKRSIVRRGRRRNALAVALFVLLRFVRVLRQVKAVGRILHSRQRPQRGRRERHRRASKSGFVVDVF